MMMIVRIMTIRLEIVEGMRNRFPAEKNEMWDFWGLDTKEHTGL
jgi:hypothetical protein